MTNNNDDLCSYDIVTQLPSNIKRISSSQNNYQTDSYSVEIKNKSVSYSSEIFQSDVPIKVLREKIKDDSAVDTISKGGKSNGSDKSINSTNSNKSNHIAEITIPKNNNLPKNNVDTKTELTKPSRNKDLYKKHYTINTKIQTPIIEGDGESSDGTDTDTFSCSTYNTMLSGLENKYNSARIVPEKNKKKELYIETKKITKQDISDDESSEEYSMTPETIDYVASKINTDTKKLYSHNEHQQNNGSSKKYFESPNVNSRKGTISLSYSAIVLGKHINNFCTYGQGAHSSDNRHHIEYLAPCNGQIREFAVKVDSNFPIKNNTRFGIMVNGQKLKGHIIYIGPNDMKNVKKKLGINHDVQKYDTISLYSEQGSLQEYSMSGFIIFDSDV